MANFPNSQGRKVVLALIQTIVDHKAYLSEVDGKIGDGDHGINMAKGFNLIKDRLGDKEISLGDGLGLIGKTLMTEIGGSMGPIYGTFFIQMCLKSKNQPETDARLFGEMLKAARVALEDLGGAKVGDKTLMDTVIPAQETYQAAVEAGASLPEALKKMVDAAEAGKNSTVELVAKIGRSARLGERSRGVLDAGATSAALILQTFARVLWNSAGNRPTSS
jgi:dihydroxyacetone kinase-like protein